MEYYKKFEMCKLKARNLSLDCMNYYCESCYKLIHEKEATIHHLNEKSDYFIPFDTKCKEHPSNPLAYFVWIIKVIYINKYNF